MFPWLVQIASQGIVILVNGPPGNVTAGYDEYANSPRSNASWLTQSIDWAVQNAGKGNYTHLDAGKIAVAGQSCGGIEAYGVWNDTRVGMVGIFNSGGNMIGGASPASKINKPIFYVLGGETDMAYKPVSNNFEGTKSLEEPNTDVNDRVRLIMLPFQQQLQLGRVISRLDMVELTTSSMEARLVLPLRTCSTGC